MLLDINVKLPERSPTLKISCIPKRTLSTQKTQHLEYSTWYLLMLLPTFILLIVGVVTTWYIYRKLKSTPLILHHVSSTVP